MIITATDTSRDMKLPWRRVSGLAVAVALALTACTPDEDSAEFEEAEQAGQTEEEIGEDDAEEAEDDDGAEEDEGTPEDAQDASEDDDTSSAESSGESSDVTLGIEDALQTVTYATQGEVEGEITMGLQSLEVIEQGMMVTVSFVPEYDEAELDGPAYFHTELHDAEFDFSNYLLPMVSDRQNLKADYVPHGADFPALAGWATDIYDPAWASQVNVPVRSGETLTLWAYFPAPEDDVETLDVSVVPGVQEFQNVEIDWAGYESDDFYGEEDSSGEDETDE